MPHGRNGRVHGSRLLRREPDTNQARVACTNAGTNDRGELRGTDTCTDRYRSNGARVAVELLRLPQPRVRTRTMQLLTVLRMAT